ncbi:PAS domain S-box protein [Psychrobacillus antarcticus]|uniref:PAS domain S-box protein n=1 Tax=Psychrobacillus antarcticus TaxID=2879115 RepID=UPI00387E8DE8
MKLNDIQAALNSTILLAVTDIFGKITFVNDRFCEISQYSSIELIGKIHKIINSNFRENSFFLDVWTTISTGITALPTSV